MQSESGRRWVSSLQLPPVSIRGSLIESSPPAMEFAGSLPSSQHAGDEVLDAHSQTTDPPPPPPSAPSQRQTTKIFDDATVIAGYDTVPLIQIDTLPRGGISFETKAVGRIQFGIPPETIKDSMVLGMEVPTVYVVPVERFCRELGHALGLNFAEAEFPAYFNYFVKGKRVQLVVDSLDAEHDIRTVFGETLLGPQQFRDHLHPCENAEEDFDPAFPKSARPNFYKEFLNFRTAEPSTGELSIDTLLEFIHFHRQQQAHRSNQGGRAKLGVPPKAPTELAAHDGFETLGMTRNERSDGDASPELPRTNLRRNPATGREKISPATDDEIGLRGADKDQLLRGVRRNVSDDGKIIAQLTQERRLSESIDSLDLSVALDDKMASETGGGAPGSVFNASSQSLLDKSFLLHTARRSSVMTAASDLTGDHAPSESRTARASRLSTGSSFLADFNYDFLDDANDLQDSHWMYSQAKWLGELATVYPPDATEEEKQNNNTARVEIFKMAGGTEYIVHDVDDCNTIIGKARFSGTVRVPDEQSVKNLISDGKQQQFDSQSRMKETDLKNPTESPLQTFHPPSFGVTILGNSHGFDKNGNTSGYVLWVNGRGIMIDPPPYSSSALEREGIRPQTIIAIIITHCHADHDAGAFQKIMTGSQVAIITTPTIYKSFMRKYAALSGLSPSLLRQSHRFRAAIIGQPLKMQGAVFHFTYTLHTIPCISFKAEWRGRSIVFTGDHMNIPEQITILEQKGTLSRDRANDLRNLPLQHCDILLHEAGAPPIHTPLHVLQALPQDVKDRLYIVHTAAIPVDSGLRVAPTGTSGTLRLDKSKILDEEECFESSQAISAESLNDGSGKAVSILGKFIPASMGTLSNRFVQNNGSFKVLPLVLTRPTDVSDAWFILNLLSAVPFMASLSYAHTMEVLEIASVEVFCDGDVVIPGYRRKDFLCVFWEGACKETFQTPDRKSPKSVPRPQCIWHAGDWTGPLSLQPDPDKCDRVVDIIPASKEGVKVILLLMQDLNRILKRGSKYFRKYISIEEREHQNLKTGEACTQRPLEPSNESLIDVLPFNSVFGTLRPRQKRHLESLAEGPRHFPYQSLLWKVGDPVDFAFIIVAGTATLGKLPSRVKLNSNRRGSTGAISPLLVSSEDKGMEKQGFPLMSSVEEDKLLKNVQPNSEYSRLETVLHLRMEEVEEEYMMSRNTSNVLLDSAAAQRDKFANKVLARLYSRHAYTEHLIFSRGNFLCDTSRMVSGNLAHTNITGSRASISSTPADHYHTSNMIAGHDGCVVYVFPRASLVPFLDNNPGVLLCLLGSQAVV